MPSVLGFGERVWLNHPQHGWPLSLFSRAIFGTVIHGVEFIRTFFCLYQNGDFKFPSRVSICYQSIFVLKIGDHHSVGPVLMYSINSDRHAKIGPPRFQPDGFLLAFPRARIQSDRRCQWNDSSFFCQFPLEKSLLCQSMFLLHKQILLLVGAILGKRIFRCDCQWWHQTENSVLAILIRNKTKGTSNAGGKNAKTNRQTHFLSFLNSSERPSVPRLFFSSWLIRRFEPSVCNISRQTSFSKAIGAVISLVAGDFCLMQGVKSNRVVHGWYQAIVSIPKKPDQ